MKHEDCGVLVAYLTCSHVRVQSGCCVVVVTFSLPVTSVGRLRVTVVEGSALCMASEGVPVEVLLVAWLISSRNFFFRKKRRRTRKKESGSASLV